MLKNFFKIALRNLLKNKIFSFINILGLSLGLAAFVLILQYVSLELSYDDFQENAQSLYRVDLDRYDKGQLSTQWAAGCGAAGKAFKEAFPEVEDYATLTPTWGVVEYNETKMRPQRMYFATQSFPVLFTHKFLRGNRKTALKEPNTAILSETTAKKYFGKEEPLGKVIRMNNERDYKVTGVFKDIPENAHLKYDVLFSFTTFLTFEPEADDAWQWDGFYNYIKLRAGTNPKVVEKKIPALVEKKAGEELKEYDAAMKFSLRPIKDIHLTSDRMMEAEVNGNGRSVYFLLIIACFIILIAWVNYINLSTARSVDRSKEVGLRKVLGSHKIQLVRQFLFESGLLNFFAILLAVIIVIVTQPFFTSLVEKDLMITSLNHPGFWLILTGVFVVGWFFSGIYPAFVLSSFKPISVLKGKLSSSSGGIFLRKALVLFQFAASITLMIGTVAVYRQLSYMQNQELGFDLEQTLIVAGPNVSDSTYLTKMSAFKNELKKHPSISAIAASTSIPGSKAGWNAGGIRRVQDDPKMSKQYRVIGVDYDFIDAYKLKIIEGRKFSEEFKTDPSSVIFNEEAIKLMGFKNAREAINEKIFFWRDTFKIVGVMKNYHQESLKQTYDPLIFRLIPDIRSFYSIKIKTDPNKTVIAEDVKDVIALAQNNWDSFFPGNPFEYYFLDDHFGKQYKADQQFGKVFLLFSVMAIFVACLGLFGLASFTAVQKTKEIGVRKVLGASIPNIIALLSKDYVRLILLSNIVAWPVAYLVIRSWLENFAFKTDIAWWLFVFPTVCALLIALISVGYQTYKAAVANPVKSLKYE